MKHSLNMIKRVGLIIVASMIASACSPAATPTPTPAALPTTQGPPTIALAATTATTAPTPAPTTVVATEAATTVPIATTTALTSAPGTIFHNIATLGISLSYPMGWQILREGGQITTTGGIVLASQSNLPRNAQDYQADQADIGLEVYGPSSDAWNTISQNGADAPTKLILALAAEMGNGNTPIEVPEKIHNGIFNGKEFAIATYHVGAPGHAYSIVMAGTIQPNLFILVSAETTLGNQQNLRSILDAVLSSIEISSTASPAATQTPPASGPGPTKLTGHTRDVDSVAWSPDGKQLASGSYDNTIIIWDATSGKQQRVLTGHTDRVASVAWSPDGKQLASGSGDQTIIIWDVATGKPQATLTGRTGPVWSVAWSPDGKQLAAGIADGTIILWDVANAKP